MAFYYIKAGGTAVGDAGRSAAKRTGSFAAMGVSAYYDNIREVFGGAVPTTPTVSGDFVVVSSSHDYILAATIFYTIPTGVVVVSVDDTAAENYLKGATERATGSASDVVVSSANATLIGLILKQDDNLIPVNAAGNRTTFYDCELHSITGSANLITLTQDGASCEFHQCGFYYGGTGCYFSLTKGATARFVGCYGVSGTLKVTGPLFRGGGSGGSHITVESSDISQLLASSGTMTDSGTVSTEGSTTFEMNRCILPDSVDLIASIALPDVYIRLTSIGFASSPDSLHYYATEHYYGTVSQDTAVYRTAGATYDGVSRFSSEAISSVHAVAEQGLVIELASEYINTDNYTTDVTFTVHLAVDGSTTALNDDEFWIEVEYADGADNALGVVANTKLAPLAIGAALTTETALWTGLGGTNKQMSISKTISIGTTAGAIASGMVRVKAYLTKASQIVFVCPQVEIS